MTGFLNGEWFAQR